MKFLKADLDTIVDHLQAGIDVGVKLVGFPRDKELLEPSDFLYYHAKGDGIGEYKVGGQTYLLKDSYDLARQMERMHDRNDLGEVIDVEALEELQQSEINHVMDMLKEKGLYEPNVPAHVEDLIKFGDGPFIDIEREFFGRLVTFHPMVRTIGKVDLDYYGVQCPSKKGDGSYRIEYFPWNVPLVIT